MRSPVDSTAKSFTPKSIPIVPASVVGILTGSSLPSSHKTEAKNLPVGVRLIVMVLIVPTHSRLMTALICRLYRTIRG